VLETSELKQAKSEIKRLNDELEQRAEGALLESQADLARVTRAVDLGELVATIAHEVNQPLTAVVTNGNFC